MDDIKLDPEELRNVEQVMREDTEEVKTAIKEFADELLELSKVWQGSDANEFYKNAVEYVNKMQRIPEAMSLMTKAINKSNDSLTEGDEEFSRLIDKDVNEEFVNIYETRNSNN